MATPVIESVLDLPTSGNDINIPAGTTAVYWFWSYWNAADGSGLASVTLNSQAPDEQSEIETGSSGGDNPATGVCVWYNPSTGNQDLTFSFDAATSAGEVSCAVCVSGGDLAGWRDVGHDNGDHTDPITTTIDSNTSDLVLKHDNRYTTTTDAPDLSAGWTTESGEDVTKNNRAYRLSSCDSPGASTTVCDGEQEYYSGLTAVSIPEAAAPGPVTVTVDEAARISEYNKMKQISKVGVFG